jgi:hypothetical protein
MEPDKHLPLVEGGEARPGPLPELPRPGEEVRWRQPWHANVLGWLESYGPGPFPVVRLVDKSELGLPAGVVVMTKLGEREINVVWLAAVGEPEAGTSAP